MKLIEAIAAGDVKRVRALLAAVPAPNLGAKYPGDETPLQLAAFLQHRQLVAMLLQAGADPRVRDRDDGRTPLHLAARQRDAEITCLLLRHGAEVNAPSSGGSSALQCAVQHGRHEVARALLASGADPNMHSSRGFHPLHNAVATRSHEMVSMLLAAGADPNWADANGTSILFQALGRQHDECARVLLADPGIRLPPGNRVRDDLRPDVHNLVRRQGRMQEVADAAALAWALHCNLLCPAPVQRFAAVTARLPPELRYLVALRGAKSRLDAPLADHTRASAAHLLKCAAAQVLPNAPIKA